MDKTINKKIRIRELSRKDLGNVGKSLDLINSLVEENARILFNKKKSLKEEKEWLKGQIKKTKKNKTVFLIAEDDNQFIGTVEVYLGVGRRENIGYLGINIRKGYRGIGLGSYLMDKIIKLAKKKLKPKPKIIRLSTFAANRPVVSFYEKCGFRKIAIIPKQMEWRGRLYDEMIMLLCL